MDLLVQEKPYWQRHWQGEAGVPIFPVSGSDFVQVYAGLGASRIRNLFKKS